MATEYEEDFDVLENENLDFLLKFDPEVQEAINSLFPSDDPLDQPNFNVIDYINSIFPTEQSLSKIDDVILSIQQRIRGLDDNIRGVIQGQDNISEQGKDALQDAQLSIQQLFEKITDIKNKAEKSEEMVKEITKEIKESDNAKKNLTTSITTLNHLNMLIGGANSLESLIKSRHYGEVANLLQGVQEVLEHFKSYSDISQISQLADRVHRLQDEAAAQILSDFKDAFQSSSSKSRGLSHSVLRDACRVVDILQPSVKRNLISWVVKAQLAEYLVLFEDNQEEAWLDKIDKRFAWIKRTLIEFEQKFSRLFPTKWEISEHIAVEFCNNTRERLGVVMERRRVDIDVKLLQFAIQRTIDFETLLNKRFTGVTLESEQIVQQEDLSSLDDTNPFFEASSEEKELEPKPVMVSANPFQGIISQCYESFLSIYTESQDKNLSDLILRFVGDLRTHEFRRLPADMEDSCILPSAADLFVFYKNCMVQCSQWSTGLALLELSRTFQKYLREYANIVLINGLPKVGPTGSSNPGSGISGATSLLRELIREEGNAPKLSELEQIKACSILCTAEYCMETTQQLETKLKEKVEPKYRAQLDLSAEQDAFHTVISQCVQILVQDLESACEPALIAMIKLQWQQIETVGDQSQYINAIINHLKNNVLIIRDGLSSSRKYFTQFCLKFANGFISRFINNIFRCKPISTVGAEQLLLDTHSMKTVLSELPSLGSQVQRKPPASFTKIVLKGMTRAEMILKVVMSPLDQPKAFVDNYLKLLPDSDGVEFQKVLEMKGVKKNDQSYLLDIYKSERPMSGNQAELSKLPSPTQETSGIKKLEKLIKKRL